MNPCIARGFRWFSRSRFLRCGVCCVPDLSVDPDFRDLDDHVAVELDLCAELLEQGRPDAYEPFFRDTIQAWVPLFADS